MQLGIVAKDPRRLKCQELILRAKKEDELAKPGLVRPDPLKCVPDAGTGKSGM